jgi:hypothetical protein
MSLTEWTGKSMSWCWIGCCTSRLNWDWKRNNVGAKPGWPAAVQLSWPCWSARICLWQIVAVKCMNNLKSQKCNSNIWFRAIFCKDGSDGISTISLSECHDREQRCFGNYERKTRDPECQPLPTLQPGIEVPSFLFSTSDCLTLIS